jgi:hypothetical protein
MNSDPDWNGAVSTDARARRGRVLAPVAEALRTAPAGCRGPGGMRLFPTQSYRCEKFPATGDTENPRRRGHWGARGLPPQIMPAEELARRRRSCGPLEGEAWYWRPTRGDLGVSAASLTRR